jgi:hypothetical protein
MAKKHTKILALDAKPCRFGKISNNLEKHGKEWVTAFTIPVSELMLTKPELNAFMRDKYCHQSWFDTSRGNQAAEPMAWWGGECFHVSESFEADQGAVICSGNKQLDFESEGDPKEDNYRPAIVVDKIKLTPQVGGLTELACSIYLRPGIGRTNLTLQDHQHREVKLTLIDAKVAEREKRQPQLPMGEPGSAAETPEGPTSGANTEEPGGATTATH